MNCDVIYTFAHARSFLTHACKWRQDQYVGKFLENESALEQTVK